MWSYSCTYKLHHACLYPVSVHQIVLPMTWLTYSGRFTNISGHPSAAGRAQDSESSPVKDRCSTTVPRNQPVWQYSDGNPFKGGTECRGHDILKLAKTHHDTSHCAEKMHTWEVSCVVLRNDTPAVASRQHALHSFADVMSANTLFVCLSYSPLLCVADGQNACYLLLTLFYAMQRSIAMQSA